MNEIEKALETIKYLNFCGLCTTGDCKNCAKKIAKDKAIQALKKQVAKKPVFTCDNEVIHCPNCDYDLMGGVELDAETDPQYCWKCGQKLNWDINKESEQSEEYNNLQHKEGDSLNGGIVGIDREFGPYR